MKLSNVLLSIGLLLAARSVQAQEWEIGGIGGAGILSSVPLSSSAGAAETGFKGGAAFGALLGHDMYRHLGGEVRYTYRKSDLTLTQGAKSATFTGMSHRIHYDFMIYATGKKSRIRPFAAVGGGIKVFKGTGAEAAFQPLNNFAYLTKTQEWKPMLSIGAGLKFKLAKNVWMRTEFRDYVTQFPKQVIALAPGVTMSRGFLQDFVPMVGISAIF